MVAVISLYHCHPRYIKTPKIIRRFIVTLCKKIEMKRHGPTLVERFAEGPLEGCSAMQFIETSSVTVHFDETENRAFIDIFSCKYFNPRVAEKFAKSFFKARRSSLLSYLKH